MIPMKVTINKSEILPGPNEVLIDYRISRILRSFASDESSRPTLQCARISADVMAATDGHALVELKVESKGEMAVSVTPRIIHRDMLLAVRAAGDRMAVNLETGEVTVRGNGPMYPFRLPDVQHTWLGSPYPEYQSLIEKASAKPHVARVGINPTLLQRAMDVCADHCLILEIPENGPDGHVIAPIPFYAQNSGVRGILMPMRIVE